MYSLNGKTILITGASSGIGAEFARQLGSRARRLVLVARSEERLRALASELPCDCRILAADLAEHGAVDRVLAEIRDLEIDVLINNAGVGIGGAFLAAEEARIVRMLELNMVALTVLTRRLLPAMVKRRAGAILFVGSTSGCQPAPWLAAYAASKAYVNHLAEALAAELVDTGVTVTLLAPGTTRTRFFDGAGLPTERMLAMAQDAATVAANGLRALERGRHRTISGAHNWLLIFVQRFLPRALVLSVTGRIFRSRSPESTA